MDETRKPSMTLHISMDSDNVIDMHVDGEAELFTLIVMAEAAHQMLLSQYLQLAAATVQKREQFRPKLLVPQQ